MKTIVFAYHNIGYIALTELVIAGYDIQAVFTHIDNPQENIFFNSVAVKAIEMGLAVYAPENVNHPLWVERIKKLKPNIFFSFNYRQLLSPKILELAPQGGFNLHSSLLPRYRGCSPINWVLVNGESETGVTLHKMIKKVDQGAIVGQRKVIIDPKDTAFTLHEKITHSAKILLRDLLPKIKKGSINLLPQNEEESSYFSRRSATNGKIDWYKSAVTINNLIRAVTKPYPGAFSYLCEKKIIIWQSRSLDIKHHEKPGTIIKTDPLIVACAEGALEVITAQSEHGLFLSGKQLAQEIGIIEKGYFNLHQKSQKKTLTRVLILGVNGFIGNHLTKRLLSEDNYEIYGLDISSNAISCFISHPRFNFFEGDISIQSEWIEYYIKKCDIVLPLVAIATPIEYIRHPIRVFELDFEENLKIVRYCVKYKKRIIFPSTSEVYGMCDDQEFNEETSYLIVGPINKQRWIYSVSKQLLDRIIWAYGIKEGLKFTLFRPFNWIGPKLDSLDAARIGRSRAITQLILNLVDGTPIKLIDGGEQKRCFTDIKDGIEALFRIIENYDNCCDGKIINIGNPSNEASIRSLAEMLVKNFKQHKLYNHFPPFVGYKKIESSSYYGKGYQDVLHRTPCIKNAQSLLNWQPKISMEETIKETLDFFLQSTFIE